MSQYRPPNVQNWKITLLLLAILVLAVAGGAIGLVEMGTTWGLALWLVLLVISLFLLVKWHAGNFAYRCRKCGNEFHISALRDFLRPHGFGNGGWKYLRCPRCRKWSKAAVLQKSKPDSTER